MICFYLQEERLGLSPDFEEEEEESELGDSGHQREKEEEEEEDANTMGEKDGGYDNNESDETAEVSDKKKVCLIQWRI